MPQVLVLEGPQEFLTHNIQAISLRVLCVSADVVLTVIPVDAPYASAKFYYNVDTVTASSMYTLKRLPKLHLN